MYLEKSYLEGNERSQKLVKYKFSLKSQKNSLALKQVMEEQYSRKEHFTIYLSIQFCKVYSKGYCITFERNTGCRGWCINFQVRPLKGKKHFVI